jgi:hypothetical protein
METDGRVDPTDELSRSSIARGHYLKSVGIVVQFGGKRE